MKLAILSNVTVEVLAGMLKAEHEVWLAPGFGAWMETALKVPAQLREFGPEAIYILLDRHFEGARGWTEHDVAAAVESLRQVFPKVPVVVPAIAELAADIGEEFYEPKMWQLAAMPFSLKGLRELAKLFTYKKVLCLDLDNTLWKGVAGEDFDEDIIPEVEFQRQVKALKERGVLLAVVSKNDRVNVERRWHDERMVLKEEDFVSIKLSWEPKAENLAKLARELDLGLESMVFVDDNPAERSQMRALRPEVCTAAFPADLSVYFPEREMTHEDAARTAHYQAEAVRREFSAGLTAEEYLKGLEIRTEIHPMRDYEIKRVAQLSQKTNQFNVCTNRYSEEEVRRLAADDAHVFLTLHAADRFGNLGLVAFVQVAKAADSSEGVYEVVDWVMSCRAMNRRIEFTMQQEVERILRERGAVKLVATWRRTLKNEPVRELYEGFGFELVAISADEKRYEKSFR